MSKEVKEIIDELSKGKYLTLNGKPMSLNELSDFVNKQANEIKRLKSNEKALAELLNKEQKKNKKAIEYIKNKKYIENDDDFILGNEVVPVKKLLEILKGEDKE